MYDRHLADAIGDLTLSLFAQLDEPTSEQTDGLSDANLALFADLRATIGAAIEQRIADWSADHGLTEFRFADVIDHLHRAGVPAYVAHTGGGTATIYAGVPTLSDDGDAVYPVMAGPGWFSDDQGRSDPHAYGTTVEFFIGPDDDGMTYPVQVETADAAEIAEIIAAMVRGAR
jgi:hypothetical protein